VRREWELEDLIEYWTLDEEDVRLAGQQIRRDHLGFALTLPAAGDPREPAGGGELKLRQHRHLPRQRRGPGRHGPEHAETSTLALHLIQAALANG
jgi:hypothetical protein